MLKYKIIIHKTAITKQRCGGGVGWGGVGCTLGGERTTRLSSLGLLEVIYRSGIEGDWPMENYNGQSKRNNKSVSGIKCAAVWTCTDATKQKESHFAESQSNHKSKSFQLQPEPFLSLLLERFWKQIK